MASKRLKKKRQQQRRQQTVIKSGYSEQQVKKLSKQQLEEIAKPIEKKQARSQAVKNSYKQREKFIKQYELKDVTNRSSWEKIRFQYFLNLGMQPEDIDPKWVSTANRFEKHRDIENMVFTAKDWLFVTWADKSGNVDLARIKPFYDDLTISQMDRFIDENLANINNGKGSSGRAGHTVAFKGDYHRLKKLIPYYEEREYQTLVFSNKWTLMGLKKLLAVTTDVSTEASRKEVYEQVVSYVKRNIPVLKEFF